MREQLLLLWLARWLSFTFPVFLVVFAFYVACSLSRWNTSDGLRHGRRQRRYSIQLKTTCFMSRSDSLQDGAAALFSIMENNGYYCWKNIAEDTGSSAA